jgi:hypothetical protein
MKKILGILILFFTFNLSFSFADNDQIFSKVNSYDNISEKIGNYTFEYTISFFRIYDKSGKKLLIKVDPDEDYDGIRNPFDYPPDFFVSDKYVYYVKFKREKGSSLMQIDLATKKTKEITKFPLYICIVGVKGNEIYYNIYDNPFENYFPPDLKVFNIHTKKDTHIASNAAYVVLGKTRLFYMNRDQIEIIKPLYSVTYDYKKHKLISNTVLDYEIIDSKIYYVKGNQMKLPEGRIAGNANYEKLYVCNEDGSGKKALTGVIHGFINKIKPDEIEYTSLDDSKHYRMNLKTKKTIEFNPSDE